MLRIGAPELPALSLLLGAEMLQSRLPVGWMTVALRAGLWRERDTSFGSRVLSN